LGLRLLPGIALAIFVGACLFVPWLGRFRGDGLIKTVGWGLGILAACAGWGSVVARLAPSATAQSVPVALRAVWGASLFVFVGGILASLSALSRPLLIGWVLAGGALFVEREGRRTAVLVHGLRVRARAVRLSPSVGVIVLVLAALVVVQLLGGSSDLSSISYDDDNAYYPLAKMLLQRGTLIDPFSLRRMSALGGQTLFQATLLANSDVPHLHAFDRAMCVVLVTGLIASFRAGGRVAPFFARALAALFFLALPNTSSNSASYYSGAVFFLGLAQSVEWLDARPELDFRRAARRVAPTALVAAAACTLRQNYMSAVGVFLLLSFGWATWRARRQGRRVLVEPVVCAVLAGLFLLPWLLLLHRSNGVMLFPLERGTLNPNIAMTSEAMTTTKLVRFVAAIWLSAEPIRTQGLVFFAALCVRDRSGRAVMKSLTMAAALSVVAVAAGFSLSDSVNLARYYYGFVVAAVLVAWLGVAGAISSARGVSGRALSSLPLGLMLLSLALPLSTGDGPAKTAKFYDKLLRDLGEQLRQTVPSQAEPPIAAVYRRLQEAVPPGAPLLYMLDQPYHLDFRRNPLLNLDTPGIASPRPGLPNFQGPEAVAAYLQGLGIRHVALVRSERSAHLYRKDEWVENLYGPTEIWRRYAPYVLDTLQNLEELTKTRKVLREENSCGCLVIDLATRRDGDGS
jgi:hypothetical protein